MYSQKYIPCGKVHGVPFLVALFWDKVARKPSPKGFCCNQSLSFPSSNLVQRRNGSADRTSATLSAGKRSASAPYQGWQLTVAQWLDFSDNLLFVPPAHHHSRNLAPYMTSQREVSWGELKSLPTYCTQCQLYLHTSLLRVYHRDCVSLQTNHNFVVSLSSMT